jgi:hypothetical protein
MPPPPLPRGAASHGLDLKSIDVDEERERERERERWCDMAGRLGANLLERHLYAARVEKVEKGAAGPGTSVAWLWSLAIGRPHHGALAQRGERHFNHTSRISCGSINYPRV